jgi:hypothetical protein
MIPGFTLVIFAVWLQQPLPQAHSIFAVFIGESKLWLML